VGPTCHPHSCSSRQSSHGQSRGVAPFPRSAVGRPAVPGSVVERPVASASAVRRHVRAGSRRRGSSATWHRAPPVVEEVGPRAAWELLAVEEAGCRYLGSPRARGTAAYAGQDEPGSSARRGQGRPRRQAASGRSAAPGASRGRDKVGAAAGESRARRRVRAQPEERQRRAGTSGEVRWRHRSSSPRRRTYLAARGKEAGVGQLATGKGVGASGCCARVGEKRRTDF
jgi:hypothetical protein